MTTSACEQVQEFTLAPCPEPPRYAMRIVDLLPPCFNGPVEWRVCAFHVAELRERWPMCVAWVRSLAEPEGTLDG